MATIDHALHIALQAHQAGNLPEAEAVYREILNAEPENTDALHLLGVVYLQSGDAASATPLIRRAIARNPNVSNFHNSLGKALNASGDSHGSLEAFQTAIRLNPASGDGYLNTGNVLLAQGRAEESIPYFHQAIERDPDSPEGYNSLGNAHESLGEVQQAEIQYQKAMALAPDFLLPRYNMALLCQQQKRFEEACTTCRDVIAMDPSFFEAYDTLGSCLYSLGKTDEAAEAYRSALGLNPKFADAHYNLGTMLLNQDKAEEALSHLKAAADLAPHMTEALEGLGCAHAALNEANEAVEAYARLLSQQDAPARRLRQMMLSPFLYQSVEEIHAWRNRLISGIEAFATEGHRFENPTAEIGRTNFYLPYQGLNDRDIQVSFARLFETMTHPPEPTAQPKAGGRYKIGFISKYFRRSHTIGQIFEGILQHLDRSRFEVVVFVFDDGIYPGDPLQLSTEYTLVTLPLTDRLGAAQKVTAQNLDLVLFTDICMEPATYFLAFSKLAPVQCVTWGHPVTTGIPAMDYYLSHEGFETEAAQEHYSETLVQLKHLPTFYHRSHLTKSPKTRADFGLRQQDHLYICPQSLYKLHPDFDELLGGILTQDPDGIALFFDGLQPSHKQHLIRRWQKTVPSVADRIRFLPRIGLEDFLGVVSDAEVMLDPLHFGGGNTSLEALAFGTPIVTMPLEYMRGRFTYAYYRQMGMMDCVAESKARYIEIAVKLGTDPAYREEIRQKILAKNDVLYENMGIVRELEDFFSQAIEKSRPQG